MVAPSPRVQGGPAVGWRRVERREAHPPGQPAPHVGWRDGRRYRVGRDLEQVLAEPDVDAEADERAGLVPARHVLLEEVQQLVGAEERHGHLDEADETVGDGGLCA